MNAAQSFDPNSSAKQNIEALESVMRIVQKARVNPSQLTSEENEIIEGLKQIKTSWIKGDEKFFEKLRTIFSKVFLDDREILIAEKIDRSLQACEKPFVGIGSVHLPGDAGVNSLLCKKGWVIVKVDHSYPPKPFLVKKMGKVAKALRSQLGVIGVR